MLWANGGRIVTLLVMVDAPIFAQATSFPGTGGGPGHPTMGIFRTWQMNKRAVFLATTVSLVALPGHSFAQGAGIGARVGTLGVGAEAAIGLTDRIVLRGGIGFVPLEPSATFNDIDVTLTLPTLYNAGIDFYLNGAFRIGGGVLFKKEDPTLRATFNSAQDIGGTTFSPTEIEGLKGTIDSSNSAPYVLIGFGKHTADRIGLFLDIGVAFMGDPTVTLNADGGTKANDAATRTALDQEAMDFEGDMRAYLRYWPILSLGLRVGLG